jgi:hypothetical protein
MDTGLRFSSSFCHLFTDILSLYPLTFYLLPLTLNPKPLNL